MAANQKKRGTVKNTAKTTAGKNKNSNYSKNSNQINPKEYHDEVVLIVTLVISLLLILSSFHLSGKVGEIINGVTFGIFGFLAYLIPYLLFFGTAFYISNRGNNLAVRKLISGILFTFVLMGLLQMISNHQDSMKLLDFYKESASLKIGGGIVGGIICKALVPLFGTVGTYIILIAMLFILLVFITEKLLFSSLTRKGGDTVATMREKRRVYLEERELQLESSVSEEETPKRQAKTFTFKKNGQQDVEKAPIQQAPKSRKENKRKSKELELDMEEVVPKNVCDFPIQRANTAAEPVFEKELNSKFGQGKDYDIKALANQVMADEPAVAETVFDLETDLKSQIGEMEENNGEELSFGESLSEPFLEPEVWVGSGEPEKIETVSVPVEETTKTEDKIQTEKPHESAENVKPVEVHNVSEIQKAHKTVPNTEYKFPPIDLLSKPKVNAKSTSDVELKEVAMKLQSTLESFGVRVTISNISCGPAVTRYELQPEQGVKVSKITNLSDDIKLNLAAADIRIEAPIPGKAAVGIEVPNKTNTAVMFRELIENPDFTNHPSDIAFAVGKDIGGQTIVTDIGKMPHLLIAGATGSGKSVCINTLIMSILYKANPADVKLIMVDPKVVELSVYNGIPHLLIPVVTDPKKASAALNWAVMEMTERYNKFAELGVRDIKGYNEKIKTVEEYQDERYQKMPQIVIIVDELADLMMVAPGEVEDAICRLAQMARAAGLHLIIATQRPSVNVITGLIKANVPSRIAFSVSSAIDSRTIIDGSGAEKLLGKGDMLFFPSGYPKPVRIQGAFVSDKEVSDVVAFLAEQNSTPQYSEEIADKITTSGAGTDGSTGTANDKDDYFIEAGKFIIDKDKASIGMLQRVYKIGFNRAARIMDQLCDAGVVGPEEGTKPRKVLMSLEEFEQYVEEYV